MMERERDPMTKRACRPLLWALTAVASVLAMPAEVVRGDVDFSVYRSLGDSLTHGTQGGKVVDYRTQPFAYPVYLAEKMGTSFELALLDQATAGEYQSRLDAPNLVYGANLAVNGAKLEHALYRTADPLSGPDYSSNDLTDVVLAPRTGATQVSAAIDDGATFTTVWLGGNDFLNTLTKYGTVLGDFFQAHYGIGMLPDSLNVTNITNQTDYANHYATLMDTMMAVPNMKMAIANFPDLQHIAGVLDKDELTALIGPNPMPEGAMTNELMAAAIMYDDVGTWGMDIWTVDMLADPNNYWSPEDVATINAAIQGFNATIAAEAAEHDVALVDIRSVFADIADNGYMVGDWEVNDDWYVANLGEMEASVYSSDGVHPSDIGHALIANAFIDAINDHYGTDLSPLSQSELQAILDNDKFVDNDLDGKIEGVSSDGVFYLSVNSFMPEYTGDSGEVPVPEPASLLLVGVGGAVLCRRSGRRTP